MWAMQAFGGVKVALFFQGSLIVYLREEKPGLSFPKHWDLPGTGRTGNESPIETVTRTIRDEFALRLEPETFVWQKAFPSVTNPELESYFFVARIGMGPFAKIRFASNGKHWQMMSVDDFLTHEEAVPHLQARLQEYLDAGSA